MTSYTNPLDQVISKWKTKIQTVKSLILENPFEIEFDLFCGKDAFYVHNEEHFEMFRTMLFLLGYTVTQADYMGTIPVYYLD